MSRCTRRSGRGRRGFRGPGGACGPGGRPARDTPIARALSTAGSDAAGGQTRRLPTIGGSAPFYLFSDVLKVPTIGLSLVNFDNNQHGPNENLRIKNHWEGIDSMAALLTMK